VNVKYRMALKWNHCY